MHVFMYVCMFAGPDLPTCGPYAKLISGSFLRDKLVSVGTQIPVGPRPLAY